MRVEPRLEGVDETGRHHRVWVEPEQIRRDRATRRAVHGGTEADVVGRDHPPHARVPRTERLDACRIAHLIENHDLVTVPQRGVEGRQGPIELVVDTVIDDENGYGQGGLL